MARKTGFLGIGGAYPNLVKQGYSTPLAGAGATLPAGMTETNLVTEEPSELCRIPLLDPKFTWFAYDSGSTPRSVDGVALINVNLSEWALWRIRATPQASSTIQASPNAIASSTNITGGVTNVDEAISDNAGVSASDGLYIVPTTTTTAWDARFSWPNLAATPRTGANMAYFVLRVALGGSVSSKYPSIGVELWDNGSLKLALGKRAVTQPDQILIFPFDPAQLTSPSGIDIECKVICNPGLTTSYVKLDTLMLEYEDSGIANAAWVTGWQASVFPTSALEPLPTKSLHYFYSSQQSPTAVYVHVLDDQTDHFASTFNDTTGITIGLVTQKPSGYVQAGVLVSGPALFLTRSPRVGGQSLRVIVEERGGVTEGGQTYAADAFRRRAASVDLLLTQDEADAVMDAMLWRRGHAGAFYVALDADVALTYQRFSAFWATLKEAGDLAQLPVYGAGSTTVANRAYALSLTLEEKL